MIGKDVHISLTEIRHAMLDQCLDQSEAEVEEDHGKKYLNPKPVLAPGTVTTSKCERLGFYLARRPMQTVHTKIRLFLMEQSNQDLYCLLFWVTKQRSLF